MTPLTPPEKSFGQVLREGRKAQGISLRKFAQAVDLSATYLSKIERDEMPPPAEDTIKRIAKALDYDEDELLALAGKVSTELKDIILEQPNPIADFLRTIKGCSGEEIRRFTENLKKGTLSQSKQEENHN